MKADEFVTMFGWDKAKEVASFSSNVCADPTHFDSDLDIYVHFDDFKGVMDDSDVCISDLKRLVESHEIVNKTFKGLDDAKWWYECFWDCDSVAYVETDRLKQAIEDMESCK